MRASLDVTAVPEQPAGAGRYSVELAGALSGILGDELALIARREDTERWQRLAPGALLRASAPKARPLRIAYEQLGMPRTISKLGVDVHFAPHYTMPRRCPVPVVVTIHDLTFFDRPDLHEATKVAFFRRAITYAARRAGAIVCVSERTAARLHELVEVDAPVFVARHGIDQHRFVPVEPEPGADARRLAELGLDATRRRILALGTLEPRKGLGTLLDAFELLAAEDPQLQLVLAGQRGWGVEELEARMDSSPAADSIVRLGYVSDDEVTALLRTAAVVAYPSIDEGFGLPAVEALACGAPLVTTEGSVMADLCGDAASYAPAGAPDVLAAALHDELGGADELRRSKGIELARSFTWEASAQVHLEAAAAAIVRGR